MPSSSSMPRGSGSSSMPFSSSSSTFSSPSSVCPFFLHAEERSSGQVSYVVIFLVQLSRIKLHDASEEISSSSMCINVILMAVYFFLFFFFLLFF